MVPRFSRLPLLAALVAGQCLAGRPLLAQRAVVQPLLPAPRGSRITLPEVIAVQVDSVYQLLVPALFERRQIFRSAAGEWTLVEQVVARDSARGASAVQGTAVGLYIDGVSVGAGRVVGVWPNLCGDPPSWCPPFVEISVIGTLDRETGRVVAVSPPPNVLAEATEPTEDEVGAATRAVYTLFRTTAATRARAREDQLGTPAVFAVDDHGRGRRTIVAAAPLNQGPARTYAGLIVGTAGDTLVRSPVGRVERVATGPVPELRMVTALDLNSDDAVELLLGWLTGTEWRFEVLSADRLGRWRSHWTGPDRTLPPIPSRRARR